APPTSALFPYTTLFRSCDGHVPVAAGGDRGHVVIDRGEVLRPVAPEARAEDVLALADAPVVPVAVEQPRPQPRLRGIVSRAPVRSEEHTSELQSPCNLV